MEGCRQIWKRINLWKLWKLWQYSKAFQNKVCWTLVESFCIYVYMNIYTHNACVCVCLHRLYVHKPERHFSPLVSPTSDFFRRVRVYLLYTYLYTGNSSRIIRKTNKNTAKTTPIVRRGGISNALLTQTLSSAWRNRFGFFNEIFHDVSVSIVTI